MPTARTSDVFMQHMGTPEIIKVTEDLECGNEVASIILCISLINPVTVAGGVYYCAHTFHV